MGLNLLYQLIAFFIFAILGKGCGLLGLHGTGVCSRAYENAVEVRLTILLPPPRLWRLLAFASHHLEAAIQGEIKLANPTPQQEQRPRFRKKLTSHPSSAKSSFVRLTRYAKKKNLWGRRIMARIPGRI